MKKKRILLVDDEVSFTRLCKLNLEQTNDYEVRVENGPESALSAALEFQPDLVLLDLIMPAMIGSDVASRLRADRQTRRTPIVFLSAVSARKAVGHEFAQIPQISKPVSVEDLIAGIEKHIASRRDETSLDLSTATRGEPRRSNSEQTQNYEQTTCPHCG